jgi:RimJ/RimL family protein N-acetyltransferase
VSDHISTPIPHLELRALSPADAAEFFQLVQRNREHLTRLGDYQELVSASRQDIARDLEMQPDEGLSMGIRLEEVLVGVAALTAVEPGVYVLGYWISAEHAGRGYVTAACRSLMAYARRRMGAGQFWAGIRHTNVPSIRVAEKLGLTVYETLPEHSRWRIDYSEPAHEPYNTP